MLLLRSRQRVQRSCASRRSKIRAPHRIDCAFADVRATDARAPFVERAAGCAPRRACLRRVARRTRSAAWHMPCSAFGRVHGSPPRAHNQEHAVGALSARRRLLAPPMGLGVPTSASLDDAHREGAPGRLHRGARARGGGRGRGLGAAAPRAEPADRATAHADRRARLPSRSDRPADRDDAAIARVARDRSARRVAVHADGAAARAGAGARLLRLRLHGRAGLVPRRAARDRAARGRAARVRGRRLHRRPEPLPRQARQASRGALPAEQRRRVALPARAARRPRRARAARPAAPAARLLRRARRAPRRRAARRRRGGAPRLAHRAGRSDREDLARRVAAARERRARRPAPLRRAAELPRRLGRVPAAVRAQRGDALHQPDQDARVHGGREADRDHADPRRRRAVRGRRLRRRRRRRLRRRVRARAARGGGRPALARRAHARGAGGHVVGCDGAHHAARDRADRAAAARAHRASAGERSGRRRAARDGARLMRRTTTGGGGAGAPRVVVIGAGPTGLSAAYHLGEDALLLEQNDRVGGWCRSIEEGGFTFDYAGHIMFSNDPYVHELYAMLLGDNVHWQEREAWIYSKGVHTRYPFQGSLYGLPANVIKECIVGAIEARFGKLDEARRSAAPRDAGSGTTAPAGDPKDCCGDGVLEASLPKSGAARGIADFAHFEDFIHGVWGAGIAKHFAVPYNRKLWAVPLSEMETSWLGGRVPLPDLQEMIEGALSPSPKPMGPNARFGYPLRGGFQALMDAWLPHLRGALELRARVESISVQRRSVTLGDGRSFGWRTLVSTMPLPLLVRALGDEAPDELLEAARGLRHVSVRCVNLGVGRERLTEKHWIYYPEDTVFHRIFVQGNASPHCNPPGGFGLTCEITHSPHKPLPCDGDALIQRCIEDCRRVGMLRDDDPVWVANQVDMPYAYVVYDHARARNVAVIRDWLARHGVVAAGRYGEWEYYNSDHAFLAGRDAAERARALSPPATAPRRAASRAAASRSV
ncbi:MAG: hypothetical protein DCC71_07905 [Proteobacteria bacterium]|nr:MAG: hypothetical protein DCC71_07905 [Pseudomonadota bacterium]